MATWGAIKGYHRWERTGDAEGRARIGYWCQNDSVNALESSLYGSQIACNLADPVRCTRVVTQLSALGVNSALVMAYYETTRQVGVAKVEAKFYTQMTEMLLDLNNQIVSGWDSDKIHEWKVVKGTNKRPVPCALYVLKTAMYGGAGLNADMRNVGGVNASRMSNLGLDAGKVWFVGMPMTNFTRVLGMYYVNYMLAYSSIAWNSQVQSQQGVRIAREAPVYDSTGATTGETRMVSDFAFTGTAQDRQTHPIINMNELDSWVRW